jgi:hypothetical protein
MPLPLDTPLRVVFHSQLQLAFAARGSRLCSLEYLNIEMLLTPFLRKHPNATPAPR